MSDLVFEIGSRPTVTAHDAEALARFLALGNNEGAMRLSHKIRHGSRRNDPIRLNRNDLEALDVLFNSAPDLLEPEFGLRQLHVEVVAALCAQVGQRPPPGGWAPP
jgi:hypothetical protein